MSRRRTLEEFNYSREVTDKIKSIISKIESYRQNEAEIEIAELVIELCERIKKNSITPKQADDYFTLLWMYVGDNLPDLQFSDDIDDLIMEGMVLHDLGKEFGANIDRMSATANKFLKESKFN